MVDGESHYLHGSHPDEQDRLARLNELLNVRCLAELALTPGSRVLDVGSGLGQLTRAMAWQTGKTVVGVERNLEQLEEAQRLATAGGEGGLVEFRQGEAERLPLKDGECIELTIDIPATETARNEAIQRIRNAKNFDEWIDAANEAAKLEPPESHDFLESLNETRRQAGERPLFPAERKGIDW